MNTYITTSKEMGRELRACHDIAEGKLLFTAELLVLSKSDTVKVNETDLKYYTFKYNATQDCLVLGDGEIFNHSDTPNVGYRLMDYGNVGRQVMAFFTLRDVKQGEQLFIDYNADLAVDVASYIGTPSLVK